MADKSKDRRVVVTGLGAITPIGNTAGEFWQSLIAGKSGVGVITRFDPVDVPVKIAAEVKGFDADQYIDPKAARRMARFAQFSVATAKQALEDSGYVIDESNSENVGVMFSTGGGGLDIMQEASVSLKEKGPRSISPTFLPALIGNMASCQVSLTFGIHGPTTSAVAACATGIYSFVDAYHFIQRGEIDMAVTGGTESFITDLGIVCLSNMQALSRNDDEDPTKVSRPFDATRDGFVYSEGAASAILETAESATARGAHIYAEVVGGAFTCDAYHVTAPAPGGAGAALAITRALKYSGLTPDDVDYIAAHGTSTPLNDAAETAAIKRAFGDRAYEVAVSSNKSMIGHSLGAAGALSAVAAIMAVQEDIAPPTINYHNPDPACDLDYVPNEARNMTIRAALVNGFGFGGQNGVLALKKWEE
ncbi:MAG TPA: beta-ketoacyl-ACP synthase II [Chloroflexia bacterium]|nr:beta-ketoacyl-ACP synthase II [Chloroflexia bacterium]